MNMTKTDHAHSKLAVCRVCGSDRLRPFLSLGPSPLANAFLHSPEAFKTEAFYPLDVYFCEECSLMQLVDVIDPEVLFRDYIYVTGTSETIARHNSKYAQEVTDLLHLTKGDLVVEVASNDGSLLKCFQPYGVRTLGVEPARNIAEIARANGVETVDQFFNSSTAHSVRSAYGPARAVIGNNVLAHVNEPRDFLAGCRDLLAEDGLVMIEVPYLKELLDRLEYDTIYHEHLSYFSVTTLACLCEEVGLVTIRIDPVPVHGGSLRMYAGRREDFSNHSQSVMDWIEKEHAEGLTDFACYEEFARQVMDNRSALVGFLEGLQNQGKTVAAYGAPAKGNTLLNYCGIDPCLLSFTVDKNPMKVGRYTPGMHIPVLPVSALLEQQPDYVLILAWNLAQEITQQQAEYQNRGGKFIVPIPKPAILYE